MTLENFLTQKISEREKISSENVTCKLLEELRYKYRFFIDPSSTNSLYGGYNIGALKLLSNKDIIADEQMFDELLSKV
ncbi:MAG: hypothetical protein PHE49_06765 [bacterium]|nr:hypothetical protein [bacterium]